MHNRFLNWRNLQTQFSALCHQLGCIQFIIRSSSGQHFRLLLQREVLVRERFIDVFLIQIQNLIVRDHARVRKVVHSLRPIQYDSITRQSWSVNSILIGSRSYSTDIEFGMFTTRSYLLIFVMRFRGERSSEMGMRTRRIRTFGYTFWSWWWVSQRKRDFFGHRLGVTVETAGEVGLVFLGEAFAAAQRMLSVVLWEWCQEMDTS